MKRIFEVANENGLDSKTIIDIAWSELGINISSHLCGVKRKEEKELLICLGIIKEPKKEKQSNDVRDKKRINSEYDLNLSFVLTNNAANKLNDIFKLGMIECSDRYTKQKIVDEVLGDKIYDCYFQNLSDESEQRISIIFSSDTSNKNNFLVDGKVLQLVGIMTNSSELLIVRASLIPQIVGTNSKKSISSRIKFFFERDISATTLPAELVKKILELPNAQVLNKMVQKKIRDWDKYLEIIQAKAEDAKLELPMVGFNLDSNLFLHIQLPNLNEDTKLKLKQLQKERVYIYQVDDVGEEISGEFYGEIEKIDEKKFSIKVDLFPQFQDRLETGELLFEGENFIRLSKMGDLAQAKRLRMGLNQLRKEEAVNPNLDYIIFDSANWSAPKTEFISLGDDDLLLDRLNPAQKRAVEGVLSTDDVFLIQGPPGTGKTTVIAEICYQNAKRGLKTLIASQSNLAVDNALGRLVHNKNIRALRKGRIQSVEDDGMKYTEDQIVNTWLKKSAEAATQNANYVKYKDKLNNANKLKSLLPFGYEASELNEILTNISMGYMSFDVSINRNHKEIIDINQYAAMTCEDVISNCNQSINALKSDTLKRFLAEYVERLELAKEKVSTFENNFVKLKDIKNILNSNISSVNKQIFVNEIDPKQIVWEYEDFSADLDQNYIVYKSTKNKIEEMSDLMKQNDIVSVLETLNSDDFKYQEIFSDNNRKLSEEMGNIETISERLNFVKVILRKMQQMKVDFKVDMLPSNLPENLISFTEVENGFARLYNDKPRFFFQKFFNKKWKENLINHIENTKNLQLSLQLEQKNSEEVRDSLFLNVKQDINGLVVILEAKLAPYNLELMNLVESEINLIDNEISLGLNLISSIQNEINATITKDQLRAKNIALILEAENKELANSQSELKKDSKEVENKLMLLANSFNEVFGTSILTLEKMNSYIDEDIIEKIERNTKAFSEKLQKIILEFSNENMTNINSLHYQFTVPKNQLEIEKIIDLETKNSQEYTKLIDEWNSRISAGEIGDKEEIKKTYIENANVIGITCVQSASKDFTKNYPDFDCVIVDEVSKATPPELILPLLKGKKVVLVGDQKQLPPMIGSETLDELIVSRKSEQDFDDALEYMKVSIFEELFNNLPSENKIMLDTQYRMHSSIMESINQFYVENGNTGLIAGLKDREDELRDHQIELSYLNRSNHLMWIDIPSDPKYFEIKNGTSFYNPTEIQVIEKILEDINDKCDEKGIRKKVALITFYGEQVRRIKREIIQKNKKRFANLDLRCGTVDRFQGMESELVIVSFVRNNPYRQVGFARDPKRINVALSRAQDLLMIVGCHKLFTEMNRNESMEFYKNVFRTVDLYNGVRDTADVFQRQN